MTLLTASTVVPGVRRLAGILNAAVLIASSGCSSGVAVTGSTDATAIGAQTETAATTSFSGGVHRIVVTYNDESSTQATILYGPTTRKILSGPGARHGGGAGSRRRVHPVPAQVGRVNQGTPRR